MTDKIKVIIADAQYLTCKALEIILHENFDITGIVSSKDEILSKIENNKPALLIIDTSIFETDSIAGLKALRKQIPYILILTNEVSQSDFIEFTNAGFENILLKSTDEFELLRGIESCLKGRRYFSEELLGLIIEKRQRKSSFEETGRLTHAEMEIVKLIAEGHTTKEIASKKFLSFHTVMTHRKNIFKKTGVKSVSELLMYAVKAGWIDNIEYYI